MGEDIRRCCDVITIATRRVLLCMMPAFRQSTSRPPAAAHFCMTFPAARRALKIEQVAVYGNRRMARRSCCDLAKRFLSLARGAIQKNDRGTLLGK